MFEPSAVKKLNLKPNSLIFTKLKLSDKQFIDTSFSKYPSFSELIFSNLYNWRMNGLLTKYSSLHDSLIIRSCNVATGKYATWFVGNNNVTNDLSYIVNKFKKIWIPYYVYDQYRDFIDHSFKIAEDVNNNEYVYDASQVISLKGNKYEAFRRNVKKILQLESEGTLQLKVIENQRDKHELYRKVEELFESWSKYKSNGTEDEYNTFYEFDSLKQYMLHANFYKLTFMGLYQDSNLIGFSTIEIDKKKNCAYVCYAKSNFSHRGLSEYVFYKSAEYILSKGVRYLNFEQDLGIESLRHYKNKLVPCSMNRAYILSPNER